MQSEERIRDMLEQYKFDYLVTQKHYIGEDKRIELKNLESKVSILSWVLSDE